MTEIGARHILKASPFFKRCAPMNTIHRLTAIVLLASMGLPASLGVGLHLGLTDCCHEYSVCKDCPFSHDAHDKSPETDKWPETIVAPHDCSICDFLAIAKVAPQGEVLAVAMDLLPSAPGIRFLAPSSDEAPLAFLARGPPQRLV